VTCGFDIGEWFFGAEWHRSSVNRELAVYVGPLIIDTAHYFGVRELPWYDPDLMRAEPRNIGVILRAATGPMQYRFLTRDVARERAGIRDLRNYTAWVTYWTESIEKHGVKCLHWLPKRRLGENYYITFAGNRLVGDGGVNFDELCDKLMGPIDPNEALPEELKVGHWRKAVKA
jgi:hypothetical protein